MSGSALISGAAVGFYLNISQCLIAAIMAFGSGVLISALSFDLMDEAYKRGGFAAARFDNNFPLPARVQL